MFGYLVPVQCLTKHHSHLLLYYLSLSVLCFLLPVDPLAADGAD